MKKILSFLILWSPSFLVQAQESTDLNACFNDSCQYQYIFEFDADSSGVYDINSWGMYDPSLIIYSRIRMTDGSPVYEPPGWMRDFGFTISNGVNELASWSFSFGGPTNTEFHCWREVSLNDWHLQEIMLADTFYIQMGVTFDNLDSLELGFTVLDPQVYEIPNPLLVTSAPEQQVLKFDVFPNPAATGYVTISASTSIATVDLYDLTGRAVKILPTNTQVSVDDLPAGIYFVRADEASIPIKRLVIQ